MTDEILNEETPIEEVTKVTTYEADENVLKVIETPEKIVPVEKTYNIEEIKKEVEKIDGVLEIWQNRRAPLQAILDKYEEIKPVVEEPVEEVTK